MKSKNNKIRLSESKLHKVIKESVDNTLSEPRGNLYGLQPLQGRELFDTITGYLQHLGDVRVSNFYSDENQITIAMHRSASGKRKEIDEIMGNIGYTLDDTGANDDYVMLSYKKRPLNEKKNNRIKLSESKLRTIVRNSVRKVMNEGSTDQQLYNQWLDIKEQIGAEAFLDVIWNCLNSDQISSIIKLAIKNEYISNPDENNEEEF